MKKKIALMLSMVMLMACMLGACGTDPAAADYNGYSYDELQNEAVDHLNTISSVSSFLESNDLTTDDLYDKKDTGVYDYLLSYGIEETDLDSVEQWNEVCEEFGECTGLVDDSFSIDKAGKTMTTDMILTFVADDGTAKNVTFESVYDYYSMEITGITIEPVYTMSEKLQKAGMNTLISMCVVFCVLILISLLIYCFNIFPYIEKKKKEKAKAAEGEQFDFGPKIITSEEAQAAQKNQETMPDDLELIAVISAAIAASEGTSTSDFVVRSINRR